MSVAIEIDHNIDDVIRVFENAPREIDRWMRKLMDISVGMIEAEVVENTPVGATKLARQGWTTDVTGSGAGITGRVFNRDNPVKIASLEHGRSAGKMPPFGPGSALHLWVTRKIGSANADSVSFLIARAIGRRGTKPGAQMLAKAKTSKEQQIIRLWERSLDDLVAGIG